MGFIRIETMKNKLDKEKMMGEKIDAVIQANEQYREENEQLKTELRGGG